MRGIDLAGLSTEGQRKDLFDIDLLPMVDMVRLMSREDATVPIAIAHQDEAIASAVDGVVRRLSSGGRLFYVGAGTSGRIGALDASECPPTFNTDPGLVQAVVAGGDEALTLARELAEDDAEAVAAALEMRNVTGDDAVVGIAASGRTPFVAGALRHARDRGAFTVALSCNEGAEISRLADTAIEVVTGPEVLSGSTRLKAGTAQKLVLNMISTLAMVRLGKTYGNLMVDLKAANEKLAARSIRIVALAADRPPDEAERALAETGGDVKTAIVMLSAGADLEGARRAIEAANGRVRDALRELGGEGVR